MSLLRDSQPGVGPERAWSMATEAGARALDLEGRVGVLPADEGGGLELGRQRRAGRRGGPGVRDEAPWMTPLARWALAAADTTPVLGVCFGHQLLGQLELLAHARQPLPLVELLRRGRHGLAIGGRRRRRVGLQRERPFELGIPRHRKLMARVADLAPRVGLKMAPLLRRQGAAKQARRNRAIQT